MSSLEDTEDLLIGRLIQQTTKIERDGYGVIEGVHFDLRHPSLDMDKWSVVPITMMTLSTNGALLIRFDMDFPKIWFPWFGKFSSRSFRSMIEEIYSSAMYQKLRIKSNDSNGKTDLRSDSHLEAAINHAALKYFVKPGDKIQVSRIVDDVIDYKLEDENDQIVQCVFLQIIEKDNTHVEIDTLYKIDSNYAILSFFQIAQVYLKKYYVGFVIFTN